MTSEVVISITILCLISSVCCGNYGLRMGQRHSNDQILHMELLCNKNDNSNETIIEYVYIAEKPVTYIQLHTETNIYSEVTLINSTEIYIKLSNFENMKFNATLTVYGFPWHPDGPEPDDDIPFLLQPNASKAIYLSESSVEESSIIATNGAYMSEEIDKTNESSSLSGDGNSSNVIDSSSMEYYDYDDISVLERNTDASEGGKSASTITFGPNSDVINQSVVVVKVNFFIYIFISFVFLFVV